jgi:anti-sigma B factor antagonist
MGEQPPVVALAGDIDLATIPEARADVFAALTANPGATVVVDMSAVTFLDSTGLGMLVSANRQAEEAGGRVVLRAPTEPVRKVLEITGLDKVFLVPPG